jgi:hypothetical protein
LGAAAYDDARLALLGVLSTLDTNREPAGPVQPNAYWLLKVNTERVLRTIPGAPVAVGATADTYLRQGTPNQNQGGDSILSIRASGRHRALVRVDDAELSTISGPIASARIEFDIVLNPGSWGPSGRTIDAHRLLVPWTQSGATWNCADDSDPGDSTPDCEAAEWEMFTLSPPPYELTPSGSLLVTGDLVGTVSIDVTADLQAMLAGQVPNHGWLIRKTDEGEEGSIEIASGETGSGPRLVIQPQGLSE